MKSIAMKLWLGITIIVVLILLMIWCFQIGFLKEFYLRERESTLNNTSKELSELIVAESPDLYFDSEFQDTINSYSKSINAGIMITDKNLKLKYINLAIQDRIDPMSQNVNLRIEYLDEPIDNLNNINVPKSNLDNRIISGIKREFGDLLKDPNFFSDKPYIMRIEKGPIQNHGVIAVQPIRISNEIVGYVVIHTPVAPIQETIKTLRTQLTIITIISLIIATIMAFIYAGISLKPLRKLEEATHLIAKGDFTTRVENMSEDEIGQLGRSINHMAEELGKIEQFRRDFIANVTHELKTPITLISAYAELVKEVPDLNKLTCDAHMTEIIDESSRLNKIIEEILYLSKLESNIVPLESEEFNVSTLIKDVVDSLSLALISKNMKVSISINDQLTITGDREKIYQVFYNLISNSINYCNTNTDISIVETIHNSKSRISVIDKGPGINSRDLPYIWDRFYKVDKSGKRTSSGTGLGLSIVKNIFELHNFNFGIESDVNEGTTIYFDI